MAAVGVRAFDRLVPLDRRRRVRLSGETGVSLVLHGAVILALIVTVARQRLHDPAPTAEVAIVFDGGPKASTPQTEESKRSTPSTPPDIHATEPAPPGQLVSRPAPAAAAPPPIPPATVPQRPTDAAPDAAPGVAPLVVPPAAVVQSRRPAPARPPRPASPFDALSAPMNLSLAGRPPPPASQGHLSRGINLNMAPTDQNRNVMTRYAEARHKLGEDWWAAFSAYVDAHKYYPHRAALHGDDGQVVLHLVIQRDGTVTSVSVELSSGAPVLDAAWISEFRNQKVPPFPPGTTEQEISFSASMTYILLRE